MPTGILRAASSFNRLGDSLQTGNAGYAKTYGFRLPHVIGSGDMSELRIKFDNWTTNSSSLLNPGNTVTYSNLYLEPGAGGSSVAITIGGSGTRVLTDGEIDVVSDAILPASFSLAKFTVGELYYIRGQCQIPVGAGSNLIFSSLIGGAQPDNTDGVARSFDPGAASCTNLSGTGALTFSGTTVGANPPPIMLVGKFINGDPKVWIAGGDSITRGTNDLTGSTAKVGTGWFTRALYNGGTNPLAGINAGIGGSTVNIWTAAAAQLESLVKYCNCFTYNYGTNSFDNSANNPPGILTLQLADNNLQARIRALIGTTIGTQKSKGIGLPLIPRCVTAGFDTSTTGTQTIFGAKWDVGGDVDVYNAARANDVNMQGRIDAFVETGPVMRADPSSSANTDYHKYAATAGNDGTHPGAAGHTGASALARAAMDAIPAVLNTPYVPPTPQLGVAFADLGAGVVDLSGGTFTRATTAWTKLASGLWAPVASGAPRSHYLGMNTAVGAYNGWLQESARTQLVTPTASIRDMTDASWVKTTMTAAKTATGIDGAANSCSTLTAAAGNATCLQTLVAAASSRTYSCWIRRRTGTGTINITQDGSAFTDITSQINSLTFTQVQLNASVLNASFGIRIVTNGDAIDVDFNQFEAGSFASTPIDNTGTRNADVLSYAKGSVLNLAAGAVYVEGSQYAISSTLLRFLFYFDATGVVSELNMRANAAAQFFPSMIVSNGTSNYFNAGAVSTVFVKDVVKKLFMSWGPAGVTFIVDGTQFSFTANGPTSINGAQSLFYLGSFNGATGLHGGMRKFNLYNTQLSDAQGYAMTVNTPAGGVSAGGAGLWMRRRRR